MSEAYFELGSGSIIRTDSPEAWENRDGAQRVTAKIGRQKLRDESIRLLREFLKPGDTVSCVLRSVSRSGMSRQIDFYRVAGGEMLYLSGYIANILDYHRSREGALKVSGCGMDMGFSVVYELGHILWPGGNGSTVTGRNGDKQPETDGGYLLKSRWV